MLSEFFPFSQNLKALLKKDSAQRTESTVQNRLKTKKVKNEIADFFDHTQQTIYAMESSTLKKKKIRQVQKLTTNLIDRLYKMRVSKQILLKLVTRLQALREKHQTEFNHHHPVPQYKFICEQNIRKKQVEEIIQQLNSMEIDPSLNKVLTEYFQFRDRSNRVSAPSWKNLDYHHLLSKKILKTLKNSTVENLDVRLLRLFIRYNFNLNSINDYYICKIDSCLEGNEKKRKALVNQLFNMLQNKPLKNKVYNENSRSLHRDLNNHLRVKLNEEDSNGAALLLLSFPQYNKNTEVRMLFEELQMDIGYRDTPRVWKDAFRYMSEYTRGINGDKLEPISYENGRRVENMNTYDVVARILKEMSIANEERRAYAHKKLGRKPFKPK